MSLDQLMQDLRQAFRGLWRAKPFSVTAVLTLSLGLAGATVMFALIEGVLLRPFPVHEQTRLIVAWKELRSSGYAHYPFGNDDIAAVGRGSRLLETVAGVTSNGVGHAVLSDGRSAADVRIALVSEAFFDVLGVRPILGRVFENADAGQGGDHVLVISHAFWRRQFGGSPQVIGRQLRVDDRPFTIVGVAPAGLDYPRGVEVWRTTTSVPADGPFGDAARREVDLIARLRSGVTLEQARAELTALMPELEARSPAGEPRGLLPVVRSFTDVVVGDVKRAMVVLFGCVTLVLLIACANVANLLLMRGESRAPELAVRSALGAGRARIARQLLAESLVLALTAGAAGLLVASWSLDAATSMIPDGLPRVESVRIDVRVVLFVIATATVTACFAGLAPAIASMHRDVAWQLRSGGPALTGGRNRTGRRVLVVAQIALAVAVLAAANLLTRSLLRLQSTQTGVAADRLVLIDLALPAAKYAERSRHAQFLSDVTARLEAIPGLSGATPVNLPPFSGEGGWDVPRFVAEGQSATRAAANPSLNLESIHPNYFKTFGVEIVRGRSFAEADREGALPVAIVSADLADRTWPGQNPVGKRLKMGGVDSSSPWCTIVGVARSTRYRDLATVHPTLYLPAAQFQMTAHMLAVRTSASAELTSSLARDVVRAVDPGVRVLRVVPFRRMLEGPLARPRFNARLLGVFGGAGLLLASVGLYAVMAAYVRQQRREIAIRIALGATRAAVRGEVLGQAARLTVGGVAAGLFCVAIGTRAIRGLLFDVRPLDPVSLLSAVLILVLVCALACVIPLRKATRTDAILALRAE